MTLAGMQQFMGVVPWRPPPGPRPEPPRGQGTSYAYVALSEEDGVRVLDVTSKSSAEYIRASKRAAELSAQMREIARRPPPPDPKLALHEPSFWTFLHWLNPLFWWSWYWVGRHAVRWEREAPSIDKLIREVDDLINERNLPPLSSLLPPREPVARVWKELEEVAALRVENERLRAEEKGLTSQVMAKYGITDDDLRKWAPGSPRAEALLVYLDTYPPDVLGG